MFTSPSPENVPRCVVVPFIRMGIGKYIECAFLSRFSATFFEGVESPKWWRGGARERVFWAKSWSRHGTRNRRGSFNLSTHKRRENNTTTQLHHAPLSSLVHAPNFLLQILTRHKSYSWMRSILGFSSPKWLDLSLAFILSLILIFLWRLSGGDRIDDYAAIKCNKRRS